jgi:hypothetical protein
VLSYQFHCKAGEGKSWSGIAVPEGDERMSLGEYLVFALAAGVRGGHVERLTTLGFATVDFRFPPGVRFPTLPVRTANGLVFPVEGRSNCAAPEVFLARALGADLRLAWSVIVPTDPEVRVFGGFIGDCIAERRRYPKGSLDALLWKEIANSTYGKTAQGLQRKRVYDMRDDATRPLPPSRITNPYFAAFITSAVRAVLGEIMNALPDGTTVFSCTTDGFLTDASAADVEGASAGPLAETFRRAREALTGSGRSPRSST